MRKSVLSFILLFFAISCAGSPAWNSMQISRTKSVAKKNNEKIMLLEIGQSRDEILQIMGQPAKREAYQLENQRSIEFLFYRTSGWASQQLYDTDSQFTPLAIEKGKLLGWGRNYYDNVVRAAVEVTIK